MKEKHMRDASAAGVRSGEKGAITIKAAMIVVSLVLIVFVGIKTVPVYVEQEQVKHAADELANKAAYGMSVYSADKINKEIQNICRDFNLPEGSINLASKEDGKAQIAVKYIVPIDLVVTTYNWQVDYTSVGKGI
jgi:uncharacterized membrane protein